MIRTIGIATIGYLGGVIGLTSMGFLAPSTQVDIGRVATQDRPELSQSGQRITGAQSVRSGDAVDIRPLESNSNVRSGELQQVRHGHKISVRSKTRSQTRPISTSKGVR